MKQNVKHDLRVILSKVVLLIKISRLQNSGAKNWGFKSKKMIQMHQYKTSIS